MTWICFNNLSIPQVAWGNTFSMIDSHMYFHQHEDPRPTAEIRLMEQILHQLRLVVYPVIYSVLYIPGACLGISEPSTVSCHVFCMTLLEFVTGVMDVHLLWPCIFAEALIEVAVGPLH